MIQTSEVRFAVPNELVEGIAMPSDYGYKSFVIGLFLDQEISFGRAAELLGMTLGEFMEFIGKKKIPYFRDTPAEITEALQKLDSL